MVSQDEAITPYRSGLAVSGLLVVIVGTLGWLQVDGITLDDAIYRGISLLIAQWDYPPGEAIPLLLNISRFAGIAWASAAVLALVFKLFGHRLRVRKAIRSSGHVALVGDGSEIPQLARRYASTPESPRVIVIGAHSEADALQMRRNGILHLPATTPETLHKVLKRASRVVVADTVDQVAARLMKQVENAGSTTTIPAVVLFDNGDMARLWNQTGQQVALCRNTQLAIALLRQQPPQLEDRVTPPPIVISEGALGAELVERIVIGWQQLGISYPVHCFGADSGWRDEACSNLGERCVLTFDRIPHSMDAVVTAVKQTVAEWQRPPESKATASGARIIVALDDETSGRPDGDHAGCRDARRGRRRTGGG